MLLYATRGATTIECDLALLNATPREGTVVCEWGVKVDDPFTDHSALATDPRPVHRSSFSSCIRPAKYPKLGSFFGGVCWEDAFVLFFPGL